MSLFRLDASIRHEGSISREIADIVEAVWREERPAAVATRRHVGCEPLPAEAWANAVRASGVDVADRSPEQLTAVALATEIVDELIDAEALLFAIPLYNFGVSRHFKAWVDLALTDPRMASGGDRRPVAPQYWSSCVAAPTDLAHHERAGTTRRDGSAEFWRTCGDSTSELSKPSSPWWASTPPWINSPISHAKCVANRNE